MIEVVEGLFVGGESDCRSGGDGWAIVHACKSPCHQQSVGYRGNLPSSHPNYLVLEHEFDLFLNMIDPPQPFFMPPLFTSFLSFAQTHSSAGANLLVHCNQGQSRAPSLAMLFLAKVAGAISDESYQSARSEFEDLYAHYYPGLGIQIYLDRHWRELDDF